MSIFKRQAIKEWFRKGKYPTQEQFWNWLDSFVHKDDTIKQNQIEGLSDLLSGKADSVNIDEHIADFKNPHKITAEQIGLGKVDNTPDSDKPISTAVQEALDNKLNSDDLPKAMAGETLEKVTKRGASTTHNLSIPEAQADNHAVPMSQARSFANNAANHAISLVRELIEEVSGGAQEGTTLKSLADAITALQLIVDSDDTTLDTIQEIVAFIKANSDVIDAVSTNKMDKSAFIQWQAEVYNPFLAQYQSHAHNWSDINGKPSTFTPSAHNHDAAYEPKDTTLQAQKHTHGNKSVLDVITQAMINTWNAITSFPGFASNGSVTAGKAVEATDSRLSNARTPTAHNHTKANITDFAHSHGAGDLPSYPTLGSLGAAPAVHNHDETYEPKDTTLQAQKHTHANKSVLDVITQAMINTWNAITSFPGFASSGSATAGKAVEATDSRLSNARTPTAHNHTKANITDFAHTHTKANISDFAHSHGAGDLPSYPTLGSLGAAPAAHNHDGVYEPKDTTLQAQKHTHGNKSVLDVITQAMINTWNAITSFPGFASSGSVTAGKAVEATDSRLSNARTPTAHNHTKANISDFAHTHSANDLPTYPTLGSLGAAPAVHSHPLKINRYTPSGSLSVVADGSYNVIVPLSTSLALTINSSGTSECTVFNVYSGGGCDISIASTDFPYIYKPAGTIRVEPGCRIEVSVVSYPIGNASSLYIITTKIV